VVSITARAAGKIERIEWFTWINDVRVGFPISKGLALARGRWFKSPAEHHRNRRLKQRPFLTEQPAAFLTLIRNPVL
jgi:hypothetical protein